MKGKLEKIFNEIEVHKSVTLTYEGRVILDDRLAKILEEVERRGSLLSAVRSQGASYSWAWSRIKELEMLLGGKIISVRRGGAKGGGAILTDLGKRLVQLYKKALVKENNTPLKELLIVGGYDPLLEEIVKPLSNDIELSWTGSIEGLIRLVNRIADITGIHLYDWNSGEFNRPYVNKFWLSDTVAMIRGYERELGLIYREDLNVKDLSDIIEDRLRYVNLSPSCATRLFADRMLKIAARGIGNSEADLSKLIRGYDLEVKTSVGVARKIARREADVGFGLREVAERFNLGFKRIIWERYDFLVLKDSLKKPLMKKFLNRLLEARSLASRFKGYRIPKDLGKLINI